MRRRLVSLDVIRGLAICGILFTNASGVLGAYLPFLNEAPTTMAVIEGMVFKERFFPIFSFLFGIGFAIMFESAGRRAAHPRVVMLRRFAALAVLGVLHQFLHPGEALLPYAVGGLVVLLPASFIPKQWRPLAPAVLGVILLVLGLAVGGLGLIPGLFLLGMAVVDTGMHIRAEESITPGAVLAIVGLIIAVPAGFMQLSSPGEAGFSLVSAVAGLATAAVYTGVVLVLLHTPVREVLVWFFVPLGRTALTSYVGATLFGFVVGLALFEPPLMSGCVP